LIKRCSLKIAPCHSSLRYGEFQLYHIPALGLGLIGGIVIVPKLGIPVGHGNCLAYLEVDVLAALPTKRVGIGVLARAASYFWINSVVILIFIFFRYSVTLALPMLFLSLEKKFFLSLFGLFHLTQ
jgi:hypothetical protein